MYIHIQELLLLQAVSLEKMRILIADSNTQPLFKRHIAYWKDLHYKYRLPTGNIISMKC